MITRAYEKVPSEISQCRGFSESIVSCLECEQIFGRSVVRVHLMFFTIGWHLSSSESCF
jgi:hypothetical protein